MNHPPDIYSYMQMAVDIVGQSPHPANKIAATLVCADGRIISRTNHWPAPIEAEIGQKAIIGNSSGTIHAETACILACKHSMNGALFITDPPCPNCAKNIAEGGIKALYIDHKGFDKDFAHRRGNEFKAMSMRILERAGINVCKIYRKDKRCEAILETPETYEPLNEYPVRLIPLSEPSLQDFVRHEESFYKDCPFAAALVKRPDQPQILGLSAQSHPTLGFSHETITSEDGKYSFTIEPLNRILMAAARKNVRIDPENIFSSRIPTAREMVNLIAGGYDTLTIANFNQARDIFGPKALEQMQNSQILTVNSLQLR